MTEIELGTIDSLGYIVTALGQCRETRWRSRRKYIFQILFPRTSASTIYIKLIRSPIKHEFKDIFQTNDFGEDPT